MLNIKDTSILSLSLLTIRLLIVNDDDRKINVNKSLEISIHVYTFLLKINFGINVTINYKECKTRSVYCSSRYAANHNISTRVTNGQCMQKRHTTKVLFIFVAGLSLLNLIVPSIVLFIIGKDLKGHLNIVVNR